MNCEHYHIYAVEGEPQLQTCADFLTELEVSRKANRAFAKAQGGIGTINTDHGVIGILAKPDCTIVSGWKRTTKNGWTFNGRWSYVPDRKTRDGKAHSAAMKKLEVLTAGDLARLLGAKGHAMRATEAGLALLMPQCYQEGPHWILLVPINGDKPAPAIDGCRLLKLSEFYAMKEAVAV